MDEPRYPLLEELAPLDTWVVNTYAGCDIRCRYCITAAPGPSLPRAPRDEVAPRLRDELDELADTVPMPPRLGVGAFADVYPNVEASHGVTRPALEVLVERDLAFTLVTKGRTVLRDIDLLAHSRERRVQISLCTVDETEVRRIDPGAPSAAERLEMIHVLHAAGVRVRVQASPWIPGVSDVAALLERLDDDVPVTVTPLRIPSHVARFAEGRRLTQELVNDAFHREFERVGPRPHVVWSTPPRRDGAPPHIADNIGRPRMDHREADAAPRIGPPIAEQQLTLRPAHRVLRARYRS